MQRGRSHSTSIHVWLATAALLAGLAVPQTARAMLAFEIARTSDSSAEITASGDAPAGAMRIRLSGAVSTGDSGPDGFSDGFTLGGVAVSNVFAQNGGADFVIDFASNFGSGATPAGALMVTLDVESWAPVGSTGNVSAGGMVVGSYEVVEPGGPPPPPPPPPPGGTTISFSDPMHGDLVDEIFADDGTGPIGVKATAPDAGLFDNPAVIFDSSFGSPEPPSADSTVDLGTPNEGFDGPGMGAGGAPGQPFENAEPLGNVLTVNQRTTDGLMNYVDRNGDDVVNGRDSPVELVDEIDRMGTTLELDFSAIGPVTMESITWIDHDPRESEQDSFVVLLGAGGAELASFPVPRTGNNGVVVIPLESTPGVVTLLVELNDSGAVDDIVFRGGEGPSCALDVEKFCSVPKPAPKHEICEDGHDWIFDLVFAYRGGSCAQTSSHAPSYCEGNPGGAPASIWSLDHRRETFIDPDHVREIGDTFRVRRNYLGNWVPFIYSATWFKLQGTHGKQVLGISTSCTKGLALGDRFGSLELVGARTWKRGEIVPEPRPTELAKHCEVEGPKPGTCEDGPPRKLVFRYTGEDCHWPRRHRQRRWAHCSGRGDPGPVKIEPADSDRHRVSPSEGIEVGDLVTFEAKDDWLGWHVDFRVIGDRHVQSQRIKTSCWLPLRVGDRFGALELVHFVGKHTKTDRDPGRVVYTYRVKHSADEDVLINLLDDQGVLGPDGVDLLVGPGETAQTRVEARIFEDTINVVRATDVDGICRPDHDRVRVDVLPPKTDE